MIPVAQTSINYSSRRRRCAGGHGNEEIQKPEHNGGRIDGCERALPRGGSHRKSDRGEQSTAGIRKDHQAKPVDAGKILPELPAAELSRKSWVSVVTEIGSWLSQRFNSLDSRIHRSLGMTIGCALIVQCAALFYNSGHLEGGPMLSSLSSASLWLWFSGIVAQLSFLLILLARRSYRSFPWFTAYIVQANIAALILLAIGKFGATWSYGAGFYVASVMDSLFALMAICEFLAATFPNAARPRRLTLYVGCTLAAVYVLIGSIGKLLLSENLWLRGEQLFLALAAATLWVFLLLREMLGLYWSERTAAIGLGMAIYLTAELARAYLHLRVTRGTDELIGQISQGCYLTAVVFWCVRFWPKQMPLTPPTPGDLTRMRSALKEGRAEVEQIESREAARQ